MLAIIECDRRYKLGAGGPWIEIDDANIAAAGALAKAPGAAGAATRHHHRHRDFRGRTLLS